MPVARKTTRTTKPRVIAEPMVAAPQRTKVTFPTISLDSLRKINLTPLLVILIILGAFYIGKLQGQVSNLQNNGNAPVVAAGQQGAAQPTAIPQKQNVANGHFPMLGNNNAKVTVVEFADFRCPFCQQWETSTFPQLKKDYIDTGKIKFYFRQYPFLGPASTVAADAAECANDQGKFWAMHDWFYANQPPETDTSLYTTDKLTAEAVTLGMNGDTFSSCLSNKTDDAKATADFNDGQKYGVTGTPSFFINGMILVGAQPYSAFQQAIDAALK